MRLFVLFTDTEKSGVITELLTNIITSNTNANNCKHVKSVRRILECTHIIKALILKSSITFNSFVLRIFLSSSYENKKAHDYAIFIILFQ